MEERDVGISNSNYCNCKSERRDCDGDWDTYCTYYGSCQYKRKVIDCDGDVISLCRM